MTDASGTTRWTTALSRRRVGRPASALRTGRSRTWVEDLLGRYLLRRAARPGGPARVLARPLSAVRERWLLASRTLLPQIRLAIHPLLRATRWQRGTVRETYRERMEVRHERTTLERLLAGGRLAPSALAPAAMVLAAQGEAASTAAPPPGLATLARAAAPAALPPLQLVLQRLREPERALGTTPAARREHVTTVRPQLAQRLAEKARRVEPAHVPAAPRQLARRASPAASESGDPSAALRGTRAAPRRWSDPVSAFPAAPAPAISVETVADRVMQQIDHRLLAWRERTGS